MVEHWTPESDVVGSNPTGPRFVFEHDRLTFHSSGLKVIKLFFELSSAEHEITTAHKC